MILGIGTDFVDVRRIERALSRFPTAFLQRISSCDEETESLSQPALTAAKRFAAKEACSKALGVGIGRMLSFQDITARHGLRGPPQLSVAGEVLQRIFPAHAPDRIRLDLSLSDEYPYVQAFVVASFLV